MQFSNREIALAIDREAECGARQEILDVLKERYPEALSSAEVTAALPEMNAGTVTTTLRRMAESMQVQKSSRGAYMALPQ